MTRLRGNPLFQALLLGLFATLAAAILALGNAGTADAIRQRLAEDLQASLRQVVPAGLHDNDLLADVVALPGGDGKPLTVYRARREGVVTAVAFQVVGQGYGGPITSIIGVASDGELLGVRVLQHLETPGLGDKIEEKKDDWILGFAGLSLGDPPKDKWKVKKDGGRFDQFSGATITPRAVVVAVRQGLEFFAANRARLLDPGAPAEKEK